MEAYDDAHLCAQKSTPLAQSAYQDTMMTLYVCIPCSQLVNLLISKTNGI